METAMQFGWAAEHVATHVLLPSRWLAAAETTLPGWTGGRRLAQQAEPALTTCV